MLFLLTSVLFKISKEITKHTVHFNFIINEEIIEVKFQIAFSLIRQIKNFILISKLLKYITCIYLKLFIVINNKTSCACWIINEIRETDSWFYTIYFFCFTLNSTYSTLKKVHVGHTELLKPSVCEKCFNLIQWPDSCNLSITIIIFRFSNSNFRWKKWFSSSQFYLY